MKSNTDETLFILTLILRCSYVIAEGSEAKVSWKLTSEHVKIGNPIVLTCTVDGIKTIDPSITRQWSKGLDGESISLNGHINCPEKYEEILLSGNKFSLKIKNVTEADLQSTYECGYGFYVYKKKLEVNKNKTGDPHSEDTTNITYSHNESTATINIRFMTISPHPNCSIVYHNRKVLEFEVVADRGNESYATVFVGLPCKDRDSICHKEYNIVCFMNSDSRPDEISKENHLTSIILGCSLCIIITVFTTTLVCYVYKIRYRKRYTKKMHLKGNPRDIKKDREEMNIFIYEDPREYVTITSDTEENLV